MYNSNTMEEYTTEWGNEDYPYPGKFEGQRNAVQYVYDNLMADDEFGDVQDFGAYFSQYTLPDGEVIYTKEDSQGFVSEIDADYFKDAYNEWSNMPGEDDIFTEDHKVFTQYGKVVFTVGEDENVAKAISNYCDKEQFWPNVFWVSDHGDYHILEWQKELV